MRIAALGFHCPDVDWQTVRSQSNRFAVAPEHVADDHEDVVQEYPHFWIVEKRGEAGRWPSI